MPRPPLRPARPPRWRLASAGLALSLALGLALSLATGLRASTPLRPAPHPGLAQLPAQMLWAWERPEDLRGLPPGTGVAWLAASVRLRGEAADIRPRAQPLRVSPGTVLLPVLHVDADPRDHPALGPAQREAIVATALRLVQGQPVHALQLDFEVRRSQRPFLAEVVRTLRARLPADVALSMTALASWCAGDAWMDGLPADEIVPMAFRMDRDDTALRALLAREGHFPRPDCRQAAGTATDEPPVIGLQAPRRYHFAPQPWTRDQWTALLNTPSPPAAR
jgi:hypothetical protein